MKLKDKLIFTVLFIVLIVVFSFILVDQYRLANIKKENLSYVTEIFTSSRKTKNKYIIKCESGNEYSITYILTDDENIEVLNEGDVLELGIYKNDIIELASNGNVIISVDDCNIRYTKQFKISIIVLPSVIVGLIILIIVGTILFKRIIYKEKVNYCIKENEVIDEKIYNAIQKSIYKKNGILRCNILELIEREDLVYTFYKALLDYINDRELVLMIDDVCLNDELALVFYKSGEKLYFTQLFRDGKEPFELEKNLYWYYPYGSEITVTEKKEFLQAVEEYMLFNPDLLK
jgi:hypothetical protein